MDYVYLTNQLKYSANTFHLNCFYNQRQKWCALFANIGFYLPLYRDVFHVLIQMVSNVSKKQNNAFITTIEITIITINLLDCIISLEPRFCIGWVLRFCGILVFLHINFHLTFTILKIFRYRIRRVVKMFDHLVKLSLENNPERKTSTIRRSLSCNLNSMSSFKG